MRAIGDQVVVVTGATSGVGRAIVRALGERGAKVALLARNEEALENAAEEVRAAGGEALALPVDVGDPEAVAAAAEAVVWRWGRIDTWVNDAMISVFAPVTQTRPDEYRRVTEVAYLGYVYGTQAALRHMLPRDAGVIVQVGSALAYRSIPLQSAYCGAKAAIRAFTDSLRCELIHDRSRVRLVMVQLPAVNTPQFDLVRTRLPMHPQPVAPIYQPEEMARAVIHAIEKPTREMWVGWSTVVAILSQLLSPSLGDRWLGRKGYAMQQDDRPVEPGRPDNIDAPVRGDPGAHGEFDSRAYSWSTELWLKMRRARVAAALGAFAIGALVFRRIYARS